MSDPENNPLNSLLSSFALGPAWARDGGSKEERKPKAYPADGGRGERGDRNPRGDDRQRGDREGRGGRERDGQRRPFQGRRDDRRDDRRGSFQQQEEIPPAEGVRATVAPDQEAVHLIGKEVHQVARVYPLFDVAKILLAEKARCRAVFEVQEGFPDLYLGTTAESVFLTKEEAARHLWSPELKEQFIEEETVEVEPPTGNFQAIARCGISGEWLGPVNFHSYQTNLRRLHRERFSRMPFEVYAAKVRTERGEEAVNAWLETMKKKTRWRIKGDGDDAWIEDRGEAERTLAERHLDSAFKTVRVAEVSGAIPGKNLSPSLLTSLKIAGSHARKHPAILIPAVCRAVEAEHLPVFKRQGKLHTGPARPHPLQPNAVLAERPALMVAWIRENGPAKLEGLWKAVLPEGSTAPPAEYAADLFWLLHQGHILLFTDDTLVVQELKEAPAAAPAEPGAKKKKKKKKKKATTDPAAAGTPAGEGDASAESDAAPQSNIVAGAAATTAIAAAVEAVAGDAAPAPETSAADSSLNETANSGNPSDHEATFVNEDSPVQAAPTEAPPEDTAPTEQAPADAAPVLSDTPPVEAPSSNVEAPDAADTPAKETPSEDA